MRKHILCLIMLAMLITPIAASETFSKVKCHKVEESLIEQGEDVDKFCFTNYNKKKCTKTKKKLLKTEATFEKKCLDVDVCSETDEANDYYEIGTTFGRNRVGYGEEIRYWNDFCIGNTLYEFSCGTELEVLMESMECEIDCENGACTGIPPPPDKRC